ncbi:hypothetical protein LIER_17025 [Lithospermum erythrorhizon]|uniref:DUF4283 domain-containing protein n=1 Tax=Lithospermum erythrorhizon TaxID=34254 RepID=A0AAV3QAU1_LITER
MVCHPWLHRSPGGNGFLASLSDAAYGESSLASSEYGGPVKSSHRHRPLRRPSKPLLPFVKGANQLISESEQIFASKISYSNVVQGQINKGQCHENYYHQLDSDLISLKPTSIYQSKPAVVFKIADKKALLGNLKHILVGKFSQGRPPLTTIKTFFASLKLQGNYNLSLLDNKHLAIECECKSDFIRLWLKLTWSIQGRPMRIFKWESDFTPIKESSLAPVWVRFVGIPLYMFDVNTLLSISNSIGKPLRVDPINVNRMNLRSARVCVELDVAKPFIDSIWVCFEDDDSKEVLEGFWVKVFYDVVPPYCIFCSHIGHAMEECKRNKAEELNVTSHQIGVVADMGQLSDNNSVLSRVMNHADKVLDGLPQPEFFKKQRQVVYKKVWHPISWKNGTSTTEYVEL